MNPLERMARTLTDNSLLALMDRMIRNGQAATRRGADTTKIEAAYNIYRAEALRRGLVKETN